MLGNCMPIVLGNCMSVSDMRSMRDVLNNGMPISGVCGMFNNCRYISVVCSMLSDCMSIVLSNCGYISGVCGIFNNGMPIVLSNWMPIVLNRRWVCCCNSIGVFSVLALVAGTVLRDVLHLPGVGHCCVHTAGSILWVWMADCMSCTMLSNRIPINDMCGVLSGCMPIGSVCVILIKYICIGNYAADGDITSNCMHIGAFISVFTSIGNISGGSMPGVGCGYIDNMYRRCFGFLLDSPMEQMAQAEKIFGNPTLLL